MISLFRTLAIRTGELLDPSLTTSKSGAVDINRLSSLMSPQLQPASREEPAKLAASALDALTYDGKLNSVIFDRAWTNDEWDLVIQLLSSGKKSSTQTVSVILREFGSKRTRGRPKKSTGPMQRSDPFMRGWCIQNYIDNGMTQSEARKAGAEEFSVGLRTAENYHLQYQRVQEDANSPQRRRQQREEFRKRYLMQHWLSRHLYRDQGRRLTVAGTVLDKTGSRLHIDLEFLGKSRISLIVPPSDVEKREVLLNQNTSIHTALLLCIEDDSGQAVTRRDIIVRWPEDTVIKRILEEAETMAKAALDYQVNSSAN